MPQPPASALLDTLGILAGADKSSLRWDYLRHYQEKFRPWRDAEFNLIEIGVSGGHSLHMWSRFFTQATIIGIDINETACRAASDRIHIEIGSQADPQFLESLAKRHPPSIVIDDGSHESEHILISFRHLFAHLVPGGWYVVEDLNITGGLDGAPCTPHALFAASARALMDRRMGTHPEPALMQQIDSVDFAPGIAFIRKSDPAARAGRLNRAADLAARTAHPNNFHWLAEMLRQDAGKLDQAESAARHAVALHPGAAVYRIGLSEILERRNDHAGAIEAARDGVRLEPDSFHSHLRLGEVLVNAGDTAQAVPALKQAMSLASEAVSRHIASRFAGVLGGAEPI